MDSHSRAFIDTVRHFKLPEDVASDIYECLVGALKLANRSKNESCIAWKRFCKRVLDEVWFEKYNKNRDESRGDNSVAANLGRMKYFALKVATELDCLPSETAEALEGSIVSVVKFARTVNNVDLEIGWKYLMEEIMEEWWSEKERGQDGGAWMVKQEVKTEGKGKEKEYLPSSWNDGEESDIEILDRTSVTSFSKPSSPLTKPPSKPSNKALATSQNVLKPVAKSILSSESPRPSGHRNIESPPLPSSPLYQTRSQVARSRNNSQKTQFVRSPERDSKPNISARRKNKIEHSVTSQRRRTVVLNPQQVLRDSRTPKKDRPTRTLFQSTTQSTFERDESQKSESESFDHQDYVIPLTDDEDDQEGKLDPKEERMEGIEEDIQEDIDEEIKVEVEEDTKEDMEEDINEEIEEVGLMLQMKRKHQLDDDDFNPDGSPLSSFSASDNNEDNDDRDNGYDDKDSIAEEEEEEEEQIEEIDPNAWNLYLSARRESRSDSVETEVSGIDPNDRSASTIVYMGLKKGRLSLDGSDFNLGPEKIISNQKIGYFSRASIHSVLGGSVQSTFPTAKLGLQYPTFQLPDLYDSNSKPRRPAYICANYLYNPELPTMAGRHGIIFTDVSDEDSPNEITLFVHCGPQLWHYCGTYKPLGRGIVTTKGVAKVHPDVLNQWARGAMESKWGKKWLDSEKIKDRTVPGIVMALKNGNLKLHFTVLQAVGFSDDLYNDLCDAQQGWVMGTVGKFSRETGQGREWINAAKDDQNSHRGKSAQKWLDSYAGGNWLVSRDGQYWDNLMDRKAREAWVLFAPFWKKSPARVGVKNTKKKEKTLVESAEPPTKRRKVVANRGKVRGR